MGIDTDPGQMLRFDYTCDSSKTELQWVIWKTEDDRNIRICQRVNRDVGPLARTRMCLTARSTIVPMAYKMFVVDYRKPQNIKPNDEARSLRLFEYNQGDRSQHWLMNSTTHQLSNVQYPKGCITTRHFLDAPLALVLECNGYGYESPNPQFPKHQSFYLVPVLDKNGKEICLD